MTGIGETKTKKSGAALALEASAILSVQHSIDIEGAERLQEIEREIVQQDTDSVATAVFQLSTVSAHVDDILTHVPERNLHHPASSYRDIQRMLGNVIAFIRREVPAKGEATAPGIERHYLPRVTNALAFAIASNATAKTMMEMPVI